MKFDTITMRGVKYEIQVDSLGLFHCTIDGDTVKAPSFEALKKKITEAVKSKLKGVEIPFVWWEEGDDSEPGHLKKGVCVGVHAGNHNLLVKLEGSEETQQLAWLVSEAMILDPKYGKGYEQLCVAAHEAAKRRDGYVSAHWLDLRKIIQQKIEDQNGGKS